MHRLTVIGTGYLGAVHAAAPAVPGSGKSTTPVGTAAARGAEVLLVLTEWDEFREADPEILGKVVRRRNVVDARHALDPIRWRAAGWTYRALGRP